MSEETSGSATIAGATAGNATNGAATNGAATSFRRMIQATVNGEAVSFLGNAAQTLLDALRDELGLTGSKEGCGSGDCGACSVIVDGRLVCACLMLAPEAEGRAIETIEGMAVGGVMHPLQRHFLAEAALQCGYCTPGLLIAAKALLARNPDPTETEIRFGLAGNLCRCTGYDKVVRAVQAAAAEMRADRRAAKRADERDGLGSDVSAHIGAERTPRESAR